MIFEKIPVWEPCSKEEFERAMKNFPFLPRPYRSVPIYKQGGGIMDQVKGKVPDGYRYEKAVRWKDVVLVSEAEANDKDLMKLLNQMK